MPQREIIRTEDLKEQRFRPQTVVARNWGRLSSRKRGSEQEQGLRGMFPYDGSVTNLVLAVLVT